jgi:hypothetical protein
MGFLSLSCLYRLYDVMDLLLDILGSHEPIEMESTTLNFINDIVLSSISANKRNNVNSTRNL